MIDPSPAEVEAFEKFTGRVAHRWESGAPRWRCLKCGEVSPDPCRCECCLSRLTVAELIDLIPGRE